MKKRHNWIVLLAACMVTGVSLAAGPGNGNCLQAATSVNAQGADLPTTLVPEWDPYGGSSGEGGLSENGVKWYAADLTRGQDYVVWISGAPAGLELSVEVDWESDIFPFSQFESYEKDGTTYYFIRSRFGYDPGCWDPDDPAVSRFYFCVGAYWSGLPGDKCQFHFKQESIAKYAPEGSNLNPLVIDVSQDGREKVALPDDSGICYYQTSLKQDVWYVFTYTPSATNSSAYVDFEYLDMEDWADSEGPTVNPQTGACTLKILPYNDMDVLLLVWADEPSQDGFSWHPIAIGRQGFAQTEYAVRDDAGFARLSVSRTSNDVEVRVRWMTVGETAVPGVDYIPASGELSFPVGGPMSADIEIPLLPGAPQESGARTFAVRLESIPEGELGPQEYSPTPSPKIARVSITPTGAAAPQPTMPAAQAESGSTKLCTGTFEGVLAGRRDVVVRLSAAADGTLSATMVVDGATYEFSGSGSVLSGKTTVVDDTYDSLFSVELPAGTVADLRTAPAVPVGIRGSMTLNVGGAAEEVFLSGSLYRVESRLDSPTLARMKAKAGRYTVAFRADGMGIPGGYGFLTIDVAGDGSATATGVLPDGTAMTFSATANDVEGGLALPVAWASGTASLSGDLVVGGEGSLLWKDSRTAFGADGESPLSVQLSVIGGKYDYWTRLDRLYNGLTLMVNDPGKAWDGGRLSVTNGSFVANDPTVRVELDRASGVLRMMREGKTVSAILLTDDLMQGSIGAAGRMSDSNKPLTLFVTDDGSFWSEQWGVDVVISFEANGGTGEGRPLQVGLGENFVFPDCPYTRTGYEFIGWSRAGSSVLNQPGDEAYSPVEDVTYVANWNDVRITTALDCDLSFAVSPETGWSVVEDASAGVVGGSYLALAPANVGNKVTLTSSLEGVGLVRFRWALAKTAYQWSQTAPNDHCDFYVDDELVSSLTADSTWSDVEFDVADGGLHTLRWEMMSSTAGGASSGLTCIGSGSLDAVEWLPADCLVTVHFDPAEGSCEELERQAATNRLVRRSLPVPTRVGYVFAGWYADDTQKVEVPFLVGETDVYLTAHWDRQPVTANFDGNGALSGVPEPVSGLYGDPVTLPNDIPSRGEDWAFVGWRLGQKVYSAGQQSDVLEGDVTFVAEWNYVAFQRALDTDLPVEGTGWGLSSDAAAVGGACLRANLTGVGQRGTVTVKAEGPGTLTFRWSLTLSKMMMGTADDRLDVFVDGSASAAASLTATCGWTDGAVEIEGEGLHEIRFVYASPTKGMKTTLGSGAVDDVRWTPLKKDYSFVVNWAKDVGVVGAVYSIEDGAQNQSVINGAEIAVPDGKKIFVTGLADTNSWYYISGGEGTFTEAGSTTLLAKQRSSKELPNDLKPGDLGLSVTVGAPFADADVSELAKVIGWAQDNGRSVAEMDALQFANGSSGAPLNEMAEAYLLNCAATPEAVAAAKANFRFESFDPANPPTAVDFAAKGYNGTVKVLSATAVTGPWTEEAKSGAQVFYRAILEK